MTNRLDLSSNLDVTCALVADPWAWKVRVVEQIDVDSPESTFRRRSLQCAALRPVIADAAGLPVDKGEGAAARALMVVPIAPIPKGPLLDLDIEGPGGTPAFLVQRADIASREALFIVSASTRLGVDVPPAVAALIEAALGFTEAQWARFRPDIETYLKRGLEASYDDSVADACLELAEEAARILDPFTEVPSPLDSAVENPALVVPTLVAEHAVPMSEVVITLTEYVEWLATLEGMSKLGGASAEQAETVLEALVDYGSYYDLMAIVDAPLDEPFLIKVSDRRPLHLSPINSGEQSVVISDARSNHVVLRVTDPNARLSHVRARSVAKDGDAYGTFTSRESPQVHSSYAFEEDRDYRMVLTFRVAMLRRLQAVPYALAMLLVVIAAGVVGLRPAPRDLALAVAPATFAASVLLAREPSALGSRLRIITTTLVIVATAVLIFVASLDVWTTYNP